MAVHSTDPDPEVRAGERDFPNLFAADLTGLQIIERLSGRKMAVLAQSWVHRFCIAQIRQAITDMAGRNQKPLHHGPTNRETAREWIKRGYTAWSISPDVTSFDGCCDTLGIDADHARAELLRIAGPRRQASQGRVKKPAVIAGRNGQGQG